MSKIRMMTAMLLAMVAVPALAQQANPAPAPAPREPPSNETTGIAVGRFIGDANTAAPHVTHDVMFTRTILSAGDPLQPGNPGAVLRYNKEVALWTLPEHNQTPIAQQPELVILYVESGEGRIDDGKQFWDLKPGIAVMIPPNQAHRFTNTGDKPIQMLMISRMLEPEVKPHDGLLVRDVNLLALTERNVHWSNMTKYVFLPPDGYYPTERFYIVYMNPMTIAGAHAHTRDQEEIWVKITDAPALMQLGSEIRPWVANSGFVAPPNGQTVHAAINMSNEQQAWLYYGRLAPPPVPGAPRPAPRPQNPAIVEGVERATIAGRPLSQLPATAWERRAH
ncbi:cupin domain-containing protein [Sphingomonas quercus]|uniref:Cupin domain-containing protein n=1 Tax=Sphingomonas quercus TaxID=2842451 RepID=A0ABS6BJU2_9SPHN|nr:cupin domain-containing protein [Sphingomonas quercus]MBU3077902.1 cupin domain-containing protein [Sphingomonas quercus]